MPKSAICSQPIETILIFDMVRVAKTMCKKESGWGMIVFECNVIEKYA